MTPRFLVYFSAIALLLGVFGLGGVARADELWLGDATKIETNRRAADREITADAEGPQVARHRDGDDDDDDDDGGEDANPIGAWFGTARPCTPPIGLSLPVGSVDPRPDPTICSIACKGEECQPNAFPFVEVTMIPTLLADGTVLADDFAAVLDSHTTAHGKWEFWGKKEIDGKMLDEYRASFVWFNGPLEIFGLNHGFIGSLRPRFVTFFDKDNPHEMRGYIQPHLYNYTDPSPDGIGIVRVQEDTGFPDPNPTDPLPEICDHNDETASPRCLGTLHFFIRRIPAS
jgi:hypothetical protein